MTRFPFPLPHGWFHVGYVDDLSDGRVRAVRLFDQELVLWRSADGSPVLQQAHCPHLGAHLGHGGTVDGSTIVCPFHGWRFDRDGSCVDVPYAARLNKRAQLATLPLKVGAGLILAWYHPNAAEPLWSPQDFLDSIDFDCGSSSRGSHTIASALQELIENTVDPAHFLYVHKTGSVAKMTSYTTIGPTSVMRSTQDYVTPRGVVNGELNVHQFGPGLQVTTIHGFTDATLVATLTPIDTEHIIVRFHTFVASDNKRLRDALANELNRQLEEDRPIWENKTYRSSPALVTGDGPIMKFRKWFGQFYG